MYALRRPTTLLLAAVASFPLLGGHAAADMADGVFHPPGVGLAAVVVAQGERPLQMSLPQNLTTRME